VIRTLLEKACIQMGCKHSTADDEHYKFEDVERPDFSLQALLQNENLVQAAKALADCDVLLFACGAGWSKDSGLATFEEVRDNGLDYFSLCQSTLLHEDPEKFYGFHGKQLESYRKTTPHVGFNILKSWKQHMIDRMKNTSQFQKLQADKNLTNFPFFILTSNVDAHFWTSGLFGRKELAEIHGNMEYWQCSSGVTAPTRGMCGASRKCEQRPWRFAEIQILKPYPRCSCGAYARPNILMFKDRIYDDTGENAKFVKWWDTVESYKNIKSDLKRTFD